MELIVSGANVSVTVRSGMLTIKSDGRVQQIERVPHLYDRLVINSHNGIPTLEAMAWMMDYGLEWCVLYRDRGLIATSANGNGDPRLWRAQAAPPPGITTMLLSAKLAGQAEVADTLLRDTDTAKRIHGYADSLVTATNPLAYEGHAAKAYWELWAQRVMVPWTADHMLKVPPRWLRFHGRSSMVLTQSKRRASDPVNAMLNYAYKVGETLCVHACYAVGMSPVLGASHIKQHDRSRNGVAPRNSMALDLLEAIRPDCDRVILGMLDYGQGITPYLVWQDFLELSDGTVRIESDNLRERIIAQVGELQERVLECARDVRMILRSVQMTRSDS